MTYSKYPLALANLVALGLATCIPDHHKCKAYPGTPSWPSKKSWEHFNDTLDGNLLIPVPPAAVCHPPSFDEAACANVTEAWSIYEFHTDNPVSVIIDQFTNYTCLPDPNAPCSPDGYPSFVVNASTAAHVKLGVDFGMWIARKSILKLTRF